RNPAAPSLPLQLGLLLVSCLLSDFFQLDFSLSANVFSFRKSGGMLGWCIQVGHTYLGSRDRTVSHGPPRKWPRSGSAHGRRQAALGQLYLHSGCHPRSPRPEILSWRVALFFAKIS
ncbi:hypothetical protein FB45DRAFT_885733, partial [Roridomyces roridus]